MSNMRAALELTLQDKLTGGLERIKEEFDQLTRAGKGLTLGKLENAGNTLRQVGREMQDIARDLRTVSNEAEITNSRLARIGQTVRGWGSRIGQRFTGLGKAEPGGPGFVQRTAETAAGALSLTVPIEKYAGYEDTLRHIAITKKLTGPAVENEIERLKKIFNADALETGQSSESIADAYFDLITTGMKPDVAESLLPAHSRAATAYRIKPEALGHAVFALSTSFGIGHEQMPDVLASMAMAAKEGRFKVEDFSRYLPAISAQVASWGMGGRSAASTTFAALETITKNAADPAEGETNARDLLNYIGTEAARKHFLKYADINLKKSWEKKYKPAGWTPFDAFMDIVKKEVKGLSPDEARFKLGPLFPNQQSAGGALALLQHWDEFQAKRQEYSGVTSETVQNDYESARRAPAVTLRTTEEEGTQILRRFGESFSVLLGPLNGVLGQVVDGMNALDEKHRGLADTIYILTGSVIAATTALTALAAFSPATAAAGFGLMFNPYTAALTLTAGVVYLAWNYGAGPPESWGMQPTWEPRPSDPTGMQGPITNPEAPAALTPRDSGAVFSPLPLPGHSGMSPFDWNDPWVQDQMRGGGNSGGGHSEIIIKAEPGTTVTSVRSNDPSVKVDAGRTLGRP